MGSGVGLREGALLVLFPQGESMSYERTWPFKSVPDIIAE